MIGIIFDQYQRYKNAAKIINSIRKENETFRILEVGANAHKNLEKFLPNDNVTYLDIELPEELLHDPKYILGDATDMEFDDSEYDIVVALDVFEHIPKDRRENFMNELYRVSSKIALFSAPFNKQKVALAEERVNKYYKSITGIPHRWLAEHIENGLPSLEKVKEHLSNNNIKYTTFGHGNLEIWEKLSNIQVLSEIDPGLNDYIIEIDKYYNSVIFDNDYTDDGYRNFVILEKEREFNEKFEGHLDSSGLDSLIDNLFKLFDIRKSIRPIRPLLPGLGDNIVRLYIDYGNGYVESDSLYRYVELSNINRINFDEFKKEKIKSLRIDITERQENILFRNVTIKNENNEVIDNINISGNFDIKDEDIYTFLRKDPQIIINFDETEISSLEFEVQKLNGFMNSDELAQTTIVKLLNDIKEMQDKHSELIKLSGEGFVDKLKKKLNK